jgi:hypothetical protein
MGDPEDDEDDDEEEEEETWRVSGELHYRAAPKDERGRMIPEPVRPRSRQVSGESVVTLPLDGC